MRRFFLIVAFSALLTGGTMANELPRTTAEITGYEGTTHYEDVMAFITEIGLADAGIRVETFATTNEKRELPLVIAGPPGVTNPATARASGLPVVFVMANIHAGEVEGKEASLMLLRDLVSQSRRIRSKLVVLIAPIYNADGNERVSIEHRPTQNGPLHGVGVRENAQGLDLNRDYMKLESPEARGLVRNVLDRWDPLVTVDLHTTNGSYHGYQLTYSPPLNPNASAEIIGFERTTLLPRIRRHMQKSYGKETYYYGNFVDQLSPEKGWYTFDSRPRFGNNYGGLRNRFVILSEAYTYLPFRERVEVTYEFLHSILDAVEREGDQMIRMAARADAESGLGKLAKQGVRFEIHPWKKNVPIRWERSIPAEAGKGSADPETGKGAIQRTGEIEVVPMTDFGLFKAIESVSVPYAYLIDPHAEAAIENLQTHGIIVERLLADAALRVEELAVDSASRAERPFQGHHELTLTGTWKKATRTIPAGTAIVRMNQPLARLAFYLLEPRSDDGLFNWNFFDSLMTGTTVPVRRIAEPAPFASIISASGR